MKEGGGTEYRELFLEIRQYVKEIERNKGSTLTAEKTVDELKFIFLKYLLDSEYIPKKDTGDSNEPHSNCK
ncbi:hypothetical protein [Guptibacillus algicola]|uniref:hypothetical protein n=1 Tax=Guptibacillus algicola TaxID=225844 RepID=UPI001CD771FA|nr:hypothetical protein [Alkalihalobacillus algicola]MCA0987031.1 hypothetical protein [Alkalihalobacillus algicola]